MSYNWISKKVKHKKVGANKIVLLFFMEVNLKTILLILFKLKFLIFGTIPFFFMFQVHNGSYSISKSKGRNTNPEIELKMQELVQLVLQNSSEVGIDSQIKQTFLTVVKTFYYTAYCDPGTINDHIGSVLFNRLTD